MLNTNNKTSTRGPEPVNDEERGQGTKMSFIHNRLVLTPFGRWPQLLAPYVTFHTR